MKNSPIFAIRTQCPTPLIPKRKTTLIKSLFIKNYALIDELEVRFGPGLNILTGQTGAGKSIIIGALNAVLGERADTETIREGATKAIVEAVIQPGGELDPVITELLHQNEIEVTDEGIILRREIRRAGSRAFINDTPVTISVLRTAGDRLVDLHGQHDHQLLLKQDHHREVIDALPPVGPAKDKYVEAYRRVVQIDKEKKKLLASALEMNEKLELHRFQLNELESANLDEDAFVEMEAEMKRLDHAEELDQKAALIEEVGSQGEHNLMEMFSLIEDALEGISLIEDEFSIYTAELRSARVSIQELLSQIERYRSEIEFNPDRLEEMRRRQSEVRRLEKKYNRQLPELVSYRKELEESISRVDNFEFEQEKKEKELQAAILSLKKSAEDLHEIRSRAGNGLAQQISTALVNLGIPNNRFETRVAWRREDTGFFEMDGFPVSCYPDGPDDVVFYISTNRGESPKPLARIASGGEISRVMLAMKSVIAREQHLPVMIFDEIDTGIGGAIAERVGRTMHELADNCQIIAITHQPQIAGQADHHFKVEKQESDDRTVTVIRSLDDESHVLQVASLLSGAELSEHAIAGAREMVYKARSKRKTG